MNVEVSAEGVEFETVTEVFEGKTAQDVDVLFVVDDSGSMGEEQETLSKNFDAFIAAANTWKTDYQIAVTTTDIGQGGALQGDVKVVTPATSDAFIQSVLVGTGGSGTEQGLLAAQKSLAGAFGAALRDDATLVIIFVSDEEDQSPGDYGDYLGWYLDLKGGGLDLMTAFAIVGPPGSCSSEAGSADAGVRYISVAEQTGGSWASICDPSFSTALETFGEGTFGPKTKFPLSGKAKPGTVSVVVNGVPCTSGWELLGDQQTVKFFEGGSCLPQDGDLVSITYDLVCD